MSDEGPARAHPTPSWPGGHKLAVFVNLALEAWSPDAAPGISPMGNPLPGGLRDTQADSWGRYGAGRGIGRLLDIIERHQMPATVMTSGSFASSDPQLVRRMAASGHEICAHGMYQNVLPVALSEEEERETIRRCRDDLAEASGQRPRGWISPRGTPSANTASLLAQEGFEWFGDCFDDDRPYVKRLNDKDIVFLPLTMEINDLPLRMKQGHLPAAFRDAFDQAIDGFSRFADSAMHLDVTVHAHLGGRPADAAVFDDVLAQLGQRSDVWIATRGEAARHVLATAADRSFQ